MDFSSWLQGLTAPQPGQPASSDPNAPMNILPAAAQQPTGILNGAQRPSDSDQSAMLQQALKLATPANNPPPAMQPIQIARPIGGAQGYDPQKLIAAMRGHPTLGN